MPTTTETTKAAKRCGRCLACRMARYNLSRSLAQQNPPFSNLAETLRIWERVDQVMPCTRRN